MMAKLSCKVQILRLRHASGTSIPSFWCPSQFPTWFFYLQIFYLCDSEMILNPTVLLRLIMDLGDLNASLFDPWYITSALHQQYPDWAPRFSISRCTFALIPRHSHSSLVFHPTEMLYALGGPDGTLQASLLLVFVILKDTWNKDSASHGLPIAVIPIIISLPQTYHSIVTFGVLDDIVRTYYFFSYLWDLP